MSYPELAEHSVTFEALAIQASLQAQGFRKSGSGWDPPFGTEDGADLIVAAAHRRYSGIAQMFTPFFGLPDPNDLRELHLRLTQAQGKLSTGKGGLMDPATGAMIIEDQVMNGMTAVGAALQDWRGVAAEEFKSKFLKPWPAVAANQFTLLAVLAGAVKAEIALWTEARKNVDEIAHLAITAMQGTGKVDPKMQVFALTVAASVFSVGAAAIATTAAATSLTLTVAGAAAQAAGAVPREDAPKLAIDGGTAHEVVDQTQRALNALALEIHAKETEIAYGLAMSLLIVVSNRDMFTAPRPWLADHTATTVTTDRGLGENL